MSRTCDISITVFLDSKKHTVLTYQGEYRNLMALLYDKFYLEDFGECKGIGRCGTCHVRILNLSDKLFLKQGNELTTLNKMEVVFQNSRLACQINVDEGFDGVQIQLISDDFTPRY